MAPNDVPVPPAPPAPASSGLVITRTNALVAAGISLVNSLIPFLVLVGAIHLTSDGVAGAYLVVSNAGTFVGLLFAGSSITNTPPT